MLTILQPINVGELSEECALTKQWQYEKWGNTFFSPPPITTSEDLKKGEQKFKLEKKKKNSKRNKKTMQNTSWMVGTNDESATGSLRRYTPKKKNRYYFQSPEFISLLLDT